MRPWWSRGALGAGMVFALHCGKGSAGGPDAGSGPVTTLLSSPGAHRFLAVDDANVYVSGDELTVIPLQGGAPTTIASPESGVTSVAVAGGMLAWTTAAHVLVQPTAGGQPTTVAAAGTYALSAVGIRGAGVYWLDESGQMFASPASGARTPVALGSGPQSPTGGFTIAFDATRVWWRTEFDVRNGAQLGVDAGGGFDPGQFALADTTGGLAVTMPAVYWGEADFGGQIVRYGFFGSGESVLATGVHPVRIAVDDTTLYWTDSAAGTVDGVPVAGGAPFTLASGLNDPWDVAVDAKSVYVTTDDGVLAITPK